MSTKPKTHIVPTLILFTVAMLPAQPFATQSAYGDTEISVGNVMQAAACFREEECVPLEQFFKVQLSEPQEVVAEIVPEGEVAGEETDKPTDAPTPTEVEVSEDPVVITEPEPVPVETSNEPLEVVEEVEEPTAQ